MKRASIRAARSFVQVFLGVWLAGAVATQTTMASLVDVTLLDQAAAAGIVAALSFVQNALEDHTPFLDSRKAEV